jgi:hypothetical protein
MLPSYHTFQCKLSLQLNKLAFYVTKLMILTTMEVVTLSSNMCMLLPNVTPHYDISIIYLDIPRAGAGFGPG